MHKYFVKEGQQITPTTLLLSLEKEAAAKPLSFQPGQFAAISFKRFGRPTTNRCFSIVSSPTEQDVLRFSMRTKGRFTTALKDLKPGDEVTVRGPFGGFVYDPGRHGEAVFLAGGIGIAPFMSMMSFATITKLNSKIDLFYGCQNQDDIPFVNEIKKITTDNKNISAFFAINEGPLNKLNGLKASSGRITPEILSQQLNNDFSGKTFFICGPPAFMNGMIKTLKDKGVAKDKIITEAFSQGSHQQTSKINSWPLNMYILSGVGVLGLSFGLLTADILKSLPETFTGNKAQPLTDSSNSQRQKDLDEMVNNLSDPASNAPESAAVKKANQQTKTTTKTSVSKSSTSSTIKKSTTKQSTTSTPKTTPAAPKCTTSQSGVTTCY